MSVHHLQKTGNWGAEELVASTQKKLQSLAMAHQLLSYSSFRAAACSMLQNQRKSTVAPSSISKRHRLHTPRTREVDTQVSQGTALGTPSPAPSPAHCPSSALGLCSRVKAEAPNAIKATEAHVAWRSA